MQKKRPRLSLIIALAAATAAPAASAAGFGPGDTAVVLGQRLDFPVQVRLDTDETLTPECVRAQVSVGERQLPSVLVRTVVEATGAGRARVRVLTAVAIDEPVVGVQLDMGCANTLSRRFIVFADPPGLPMAAGAVAPSAASLPPEVPASDDSRPAAAAVPAAGVVAAASGNAAEASVAARATATATGEARPAMRAAAPVRRRPAHRRAAATRPPAELRRAAVASVKAPAAGPRLTLELAEPVAKAEAQAVDQALEAVAQAASAARAAALVASAAEQRMAALERTVEQLRVQAKDSRDAAAQSRERVGRAEAAVRWLWPLFGAALLLAGLAGWLAWRLAGVQRRLQAAWRQAAAPVPVPVPVPDATSSRQMTRPIPFVTSELASTDSTLGRARSAHAWPPTAASAPTTPWPASTPSPLPPAAQEAAVPAAPVAADAAMQRTDVLPPKLLGEEGAARDVSIEELIDLEQQAEFFVVLGQDEAAIDLLVEHLRSTGGGSPLPYLKLMEIYHRRGDRADYERTRSRFNDRFNAYAPEWGADLGSGRTLEDYAGVVPRLQQAWERPLDAMAELEALLFRKSRGELFDLPAYREVLFLYSLARDLLDREGAANGNVDLLLPLPDGGEFGSTSPAPYLGLERDAAEPRPESEDRPTAPVDFDLSVEEERTSSLFDALQDVPPPPRP